MKIQGQNKEMLAAACQMFLGKSETEIGQIALETLEGHQRAIMAHMTVEVGLGAGHAYPWAKQPLPFAVGRGPFKKSQGLPGMATPPRGEVTIPLLVPLRQPSPILSVNPALEWPQQPEPRPAKPLP